MTETIHFAVISEPAIGTDHAERQHLSDMWRCRGLLDFPGTLVSAAVATFFL